MRGPPRCDVLTIGPPGLRLERGAELMMQARHALAFEERVVIIVIDDDDALRNSLKFSFEIEGFSVRAYRDGTEVLDQIELPRHGCLIVDYNLPGMNGLALVGKLRERGVSMPAILITTHPSLAVRQRAAAAGISIVEKPLLGNALLAKVCNVLEA
jgi:two-component system response regulator FixJ